MDYDTEHLRRTLTCILQWGAWLTTITLGMWSTLEFDPAKGHFAPQWVGLAFIFALGVAIAASVARSRMRLTDTILQVFKAGQKIQRDDTDRRVQKIMDRMDEEH